MYLFVCVCACVCVWMRKGKGQQTHSLCVHLSNGDRFEFFSPIILFFPLSVDSDLFHKFCCFPCESQPTEDTADSECKANTAHHMENAQQKCEVNENAFVWGLLFFFLRFSQFQRSIECIFKLISCNTCRAWWRSLPILCSSARLHPVCCIRSWCIRIDAILLRFGVFYRGEKKLRVKWESNEERRIFDISFVFVETMVNWIRHLPNHESCTDSQHLDWERKIVYKLSISSLWPIVLATYEQMGLDVIRFVHFALSLRGCRWLTLAAQTYESVEFHSFLVGNLWNLFADDQQNACGYSAKLCASRNWHFSLVTSIANLKQKQRTANVHLFSLSPSASLGASIQIKS